MISISFNQVCQLKLRNHRLFSQKHLHSADLNYLTQHGPEGPRWTKCSVLCLSPHKNDSSSQQRSANQKSFRCSLSSYSEMLVSLDKFRIGENHSFLIVSNIDCDIRFSLRIATPSGCRFWWSYCAWQIAFLVVKLDSFQLALLCRAKFPIVVVFWSITHVFGLQFPFCLWF